jgi:exopolysaccharide biosynthesis polyprenyl glycosylphosphotransferase
MGVADDATFPQRSAAGVLDTSNPAQMPAQGGGAHSQQVRFVSNSVLRQRSRFCRVRAWMLVLPVDFALLMLPTLWHPQHVRGSLAMAVLFLLFLSGADRYRARLHLSVLDELPTLVGKLLTSAAVVSTVIALRHQQEAVTTFLVDAVISIGLVVTGRVVVTQVILWSRRHRVTVHRTILIGGGSVAAELAQILQCHPRYGLHVVGFVDDGARGVAEPVTRRLGGPSDLDPVVRQTGADVLLVADGAFSERTLLDMVRSPDCLPCDLLVVPRLHHFHTQTGQADHIGSIPVMRIRTPNLTGLAWGIKRVFDVVVASLLLVLFAPVLALCALAVRLDCGPGVVFRQPRVGRNGTEFDCLKFRSMRPTDCADAATTWSVARDPRVSKVGHVLRRTSLDELPQLWNILRGDMTLVGPRPERPFFVQQFAAEYDRYSHRHRVRAGLTGLAQVSGLRGDTPIADRARYDNYYIENWSLWLDVKILIRTVAAVLFIRGS